MAKIILKSGKDKSVLRYHPWLFSGAIKNIEGSVNEGDVVEVVDNAGNYLATGHYQIGSISVRMFSFSKINPDKAFWKSKILKAFNFRKQLGLTDNPLTNVYRLVNGEGDGMPGLIMDYYNGCVVLQSHSIGMYMLRNEFAEILKEIYGDALHTVYDKSKETLPHKAKINPENEYLYGQPSEDLVVVENGLKYYIDFVNGQKTGFFIDQRDSRLLLGTYAKNCTVLNAFSYTGGFSLAALKGGAKYVDSVDSSSRAMRNLDRNMELNFGNISNHKSYTTDVSNFFHDIDNDKPESRNSERKTRNSEYDLIVLDPPAFGKHLDVLDNALKGYRNLNMKAIEIIKPNGILFTFSCSQVVSKDQFRTAVFSAAAMAKRQVKVLHQLTQPPDHPISIFHPEGEYLKGLVLFVE